MKLIGWYTGKDQGGTTDEKVPFEAMVLPDAVRTSVADTAYPVLAGAGWNRVRFYLREVLNRTCRAHRS
jgi:hypothetical protein